MPKKLYDKKEILDKCLNVFAKHGYAKTSTAMLAKASGISRTLIFHHFISKKELYLSILDRCFEKGRNEISFDNIKDIEDFFEARERISIIKFNYYKENPDSYRIILEAFYHTPEELKKEISNKYGDLIEERDRLQERLFEKVPLREEVDRKKAYELVKLTIDHFENIYVAGLENDKELNQKNFEELMKERRCFIDMIRYGIQR